MFYILITHPKSLNQSMTYEWELGWWRTQMMLVLTLKENLGALDFILLNC